MKTHRLEWIGVKSPKEDDRITFRYTIGAYNPDEMETLDAVAEIVSPLIRVDSHTGRFFGRRHGLSKDYQWGPRRGTFIQDVAEIDVDRLMKMPDQAEFRDHDNPDHDDRTPVVPYHYIDQVLFRIIKEAHNGPGVFATGARTFTNSKALINALREREIRR